MLAESGRRARVAGVVIVVLVGAIALLGAQASGAGAAAGTQDTDPVGSDVPGGGLHAAGAA